MSKKTVIDKEMLVSILKEMLEETTVDREQTENMCEVFWHNGRISTLEAILELVEGKWEGYQNIQFEIRQRKKGA